MASFVVTWEIDAEGATTLEAALFAFEAMRRKGSIASVFTVAGEQGEIYLVDLHEAWEEGLLTTEQDARMTKAFNAGSD